MKKIILIYANCVNPIAKGDFAFAGNIAKDMAEEATKSGLEVVLSTSQSSMNRFESLYGKPIDGRVLVERQTIRVCAIELLDPVNTVITAFIEANRCNHLPASELKRILSPETKFLFVGAANQFTITSQADAFGQLHVYAHQQPDIYHYYDTQDVFMGSSGIGNDRLGLPAFKTIEQLPELNEAQKNTIPDEKYGFIYLTNNRYGNELELICQYIYLTQRSCYVLIGEVAGLKKELMDLLSKWHKEGRIKNATQRIDQHNGLDNIVMRNMVAKSDDTLVVSTGVMSTLEAMHDGKLTYYQTFESNAEFVASYLMAVKAICANNNLLTGAMPKLLIELSELLFAPKPLSSCQLDRVNDLLAISIVPNRLVEANQAIINKAKGRLAPHLLSFIGGPSKTKPQDRKSVV